MKRLHRTSLLAGCAVAAFSLAHLGVLPAAAQEAKGVTEAEGTVTDTKNKATQPTPPQPNQPQAEQKPSPQEAKPQAQPQRQPQARQEHQPSAQPPQAPRAPQAAQPSRGPQNAQRAQQLQPARQPGQAAQHADHQADRQLDANARSERRQGQGNLQGQAQRQLNNRENAQNAQRQGQLDANHGQARQGQQQMQGQRQLQGQRQMQGRQQGQQQMQANTRIEADRLGMKIADADDQLKIENIEQNSAAAQIGLQSGDEIVSIAGQDVRDQRQFSTLLSQQVTRFGSDRNYRIPVVVRRNGNLETLYWTSVALSVAGYGPFGPQFVGPGFGPGYVQTQQNFVQRSTGYRGEIGQPNPDAGFLGVDLDTRYPQAAIVSRVHEGSAADQAGIEAGDRIVGLNDQQINSGHELIQVLSQMRAGQQVTIHFDRTMTTQAVLGRRGDRASVQGATVEGTVESGTFHQGQVPPAPGAQLIAPQGGASVQGQFQGQRIESQRVEGQLQSDQNAPAPPAPAPAPQGAGDSEGAAPAPAAPAPADAEQPAADDAEPDQPSNDNNNDNNNDDSNNDSDDR